VLEIHQNLQCSVTNFIEQLNILCKKFHCEELCEGEISCGDWGYSDRTKKRTWLTWENIYAVMPEVNFSVFCIILKLHVAAWKQVIVGPVVKFCRWLLRKYYSYFEKGIEVWKDWNLSAFFLKCCANSVIITCIYTVYSRI